MMMNEDQVRTIVEEWIAANQPDYVPVQVESVTGRVVWGSSR